MPATVVGGMIFYWRPSNVFPATWMEGEPRLGFLKFHDGLHLHLTVVDGGFR